MQYTNRIYLLKSQMFCTKMKKCNKKGTTVLTQLCAHKYSVKTSTQKYIQTYFLALANVFPALMNVTCKILRMEHVQYMKVEMHELYTMK